MLLVLSPAKTLDYQSPLTPTRTTLPDYLTQAQELVQQLKTYTPAQLASLLGVSDSLAALNTARYGSWSLPFTADNARPALLAFKGDVYTGLQAEQFSEADLEFAQQHLRILSGLYGVLRPLDLMQPYRLEMGTKLTNSRGKNLYAFWSEQITHGLNETLAQQNEPFLINLASNEYFSAIQRAHLRAQIIDTEFRDRKNGQYKIISLYAKRARGLMARYVIQQRLTHPDELCRFDSDGYSYSVEQSQPQRLVFLRG